MKTLKILIASLVLVSQSYAFSNSERNILLGLGAGAVFAAVLNAKDVHVTKVHHTTRPAYVDNRHERKIHKRQIVRENRRHIKELKRENKRHERHYSRHHRDYHRYSRHNKHNDRYYGRSHRSHHNEYAYNNSHRNYRY